MAADNFFARWSRSKEPAPGEVQHPPAAPTDTASNGAPTEQPATPETAVEAKNQAVTMEDVARLTDESDFSAYVAPGVDENIKRSAMKKLFANPHYNVMDGLDIYISDYGIADPIPPAMLAALTHAKALLDPLSQLEKPLSTLKEKLLAVEEEIGKEDPLPADQATVPTDSEFIDPPPSPDSAAADGSADLTDISGTQLDAKADPNKITEARS